MVSVLAGNWGWWRTATQVLASVKSFNEGLEHFASRTRVAERIAELEERVAAAPRESNGGSRARVGDRVTWYQTPEEEDS